MEGHEFVTGDESMQSARWMCQNFIDHMDTAFDKWKPRKRYSVYKAQELLWLQEIKQKEQQGINEIFLSSLFKQKKSYLGLSKFRLLSNFTSLDKIALGGINKSNLNKLKLIDIKGFAGISYFEC